MPRVIVDGFRSKKLLISLTLELGCKEPCAQERAAIDEVKALLSLQGLSAETITECRFSVRSAPARVLE